MKKKKRTSVTGDNAPSPDPPKPASAGGDGTTATGDGVTPAADRGGASTHDASGASIAGANSASIAGAVSTSIYDIAKAAGVNPSTVSRALNNRDRIGAATRKRILRIAEELGYQPSVIARSLATSRTSTIGVVAPSLTDPFVGMIVDSIEEHAGAYDYRVIFSTSRRDPERELTIATNFQRHRVDAVIIVSTHQRSTYELFEQTLRVPLVLVGQEDPTSDIAVVAVDDAAMIDAAADHLVALGHSRLAFVGVDDRPFSSGRRQEAFAAGVMQRRSDAVVTAVLPGGASDLERGAAALPDIVGSGVTAVQCYNDMVAFGLIGAAIRQGIAIPESLSVIGCDDLEIAVSLPQPLTTIRQPRGEMGRQAVELAMERLDGKGPRTTVLPGELVIRNTTAPPGGI
jgi:DNA-binding LacI/PurR family transcriptional regulator